MPAATFPIVVETPTALHAAVDSAAITPSDTAPLRSVKASITDHNGITHEALAVGTGGNAVTVETVVPTNEDADLVVAVVGNAATVTLAAIGTPAVLDAQGIRFQSIVKGTDGNAIEVEFVDPGTASAAASVAVVGTEITVNLATDAGSKSVLVNQGMTYEAVTPGSGGDANTIALVNPGVPADIEVEVTGTDIVVTLATDAGVAQVETATAAGTVIGGGDAEVVVTGSGIAGSPLTIPVAVASEDTPTLWAAKVRAELADTAAITALYGVSGTGTSIILTELVPNGNDATLNVALATGTATGITAAATSANTTAGVTPVPTTTRQTLYDALIASADAMALISVNFSAGGDTVMTALAETPLATGGATPLTTTTRQEALSLLLAETDVTDIVTMTVDDVNPLRVLVAMAMTPLAGGSVRPTSTVQQVVNALNANGDYDGLAVASTDLHSGSQIAQPGAEVTLTGGITGQWTIDSNFTRAVSVAADGNLAYLPVNSDTPVVAAVKAGIMYPIASKGIRSTSTTATGIVGHI